MSLSLKIPRQEFQAKLTARIVEGNAIKIQFLNAIDDNIFISVEQEFSKWNDYNHALLESFFNEFPNKYTEGYDNTESSGFEELVAIANHIDTRSIIFRRRHFQQDLQPKISYLDSLLARAEFIPYQAPLLAGLLQPIVSASPLTHLHPSVQQAAGSRFATAHYSDAIQKACTALEKAVQVKSGLPATTTGASVMTTAFSKNNALIQLADDPNEQFGFMALYQGAVMALRNHFAHSLTELTDPARALEWLGFISALFYKLDEVHPTATPPAP